MTTRDAYDPDVAGAPSPSDSLILRFSELTEASPARPRDFALRALDVVLRGLDLVIGSVAALVLAPVLALAALAILLTSGRPVLYAGALDELDRPRVGQRPQPAVPDELLVDAAEPPAERGVDRRAQRDGLSVHRAAGGDHEVGERDEALPVDGGIRHDHRRQLERGDVLALVRRARDDDRVDVGAPAEVGQDRRGLFARRW